MNTIKFKKLNTKVIAHRGLRGIEPENSTAAFIAAGNRSYYGIESDVHVTKDDWYVIIHDKHSGRVATKNLKIGNTIISSIRELNLFNRDGSLSDLRIPTLEDYIKICRRYEKKSFLELKGSFSEKHLKEIVGIIKRLNHLENTIFISYNINCLLNIRRLYPDVKLQLLRNIWIDSISERLISSKISIDLKYKYITKDIIERFHSAELEVNCFTCNDSEKAEKLASMGVDYITTDILE